MLEFVAQTTQQSGMAAWGPAEWCVFFGGVATLLTAIAALIKANKSQATSEENRNDLKTTAQGVTNLADVANPNRAAAKMDPHLESAVRMIGTGTGFDGDGNSGRRATDPIPKDIR